MKNKPMGRGTAENPAGRFEPYRIERDPDAPEEDPLPRTRFYVDASKTILVKNDSPDVPFTWSLNPYRGCEHGCIYCYARPTHEYFGLSAGLDFESRILVKKDAPELLRQALAAPSWRPDVVSMSGITDCYQSVERKLKITRGCLEVFAEFLNPVGLVTKNVLIARDKDLLARLAKAQAVSVYISITTLDENLRQIMEPRASTPAQRLEAVRELSEAGVPVGILTAPIIPAINDHEIPAILKAAAKAGARYAGYSILRLPWGVKDLFEDWLKRYFPDRKDKVLNSLKSLRHGNLSESRFGLRMRGEGIFAQEIEGLFRVGLKASGLTRGGPELSVESFRRVSRDQPELPFAV